MSFLGNYNHNMDAKGRVSIPIQFRRFIPETKDGNELVATLSVEGDCLWVYCWKDWKMIEQQIREKKFSKQKYHFIHRFIGNAHECSLDSMGRILISPALRAKAGLNKNVVLVGALEKFEIWDQARYEALSADEDSRALAQEFYETEVISI